MSGAGLEEKRVRVGSTADGMSGEEAVQFCGPGISSHLYSHSPYSHPHTHPHSHPGGVGSRAGREPLPGVPHFRAHREVAGPGAAGSMRQRRVKSADTAAERQHHFMSLVPPPPTAAAAAAACGHAASGSRHRHSLVPGPAGVTSAAALMQCGRPGALPARLQLQHQQQPQGREANAVGELPQASQLQTRCTSAAVVAGEAQQGRGNCKNEEEPSLEQLVSFVRKKVKESVSVQPQG